MVTAWDEKVDSISPSTAGFSRDGGKAVLPIFLDGNNESYIKTILGFVTPAGDGSLNRQLPLAHPVYPWMLAYNISNIVGMGTPSKVASNPVLSPEGVFPAYYASYPTYLYTVEFNHRPYPVCANSKIQVASTEWWDVEALTASGTFNKFTTEYIRYTDYEIQPGVKVITSRNGQMVFRSADGTIGDGVLGFTGVPAVYLPTGIIKFRWYEVPTSYLESNNCFWLRFLGRINQDTFKIGKRSFTEGQLRFAGLGIRRYLGPVPDTVVNTAGKPTNLNARLMDVEFIFEYNLAANASQPAVVPKTLIPNRISQGHNVFPNYRNRGFYYVTNGTSTTPFASQYPTYNSFPVPLLFTDPDA
jgi:hypothetical protein